MTKIADALIVTFNSGMSLQTWVDAGILEREWALYERLKSRYGRVYLLTSGSARDIQIASGFGDHVEVICNEHGLDEMAYISKAPALVLERLGDARTVVIKTKQMKGGAAALELAQSLRKSGKRVGLVARGGHLWSRFTAVELGPSADPAIDAGTRERELCRGADIVVGTSIAMTGDLAWRYGLDPDRVMLIPNYVLPNTPKRTAEERDPNTILFAGSLVKRKRIDMIIDVIAQLGETGTEARLDVVGEGPELEPLRQLAEERGVKAEFEGRIPHSELLDRMSRCTIYAQASALEGHPKTVLEAMATGAAVVITDTPGLGRVVQHGLTGLAMPAEPEALARAFEGLMMDAAWRDALGNAAHEAVMGAYGLDKVLSLEVEAHKRALDIAGSRDHSAAPPVRWMPEMAGESLARAADSWYRAIEGYAERRTPQERVEFLSALERLIRQMPRVADAA